MRYSHINRLAFLPASFKQAFTFSPVLMEKTAQEGRHILADAWWWVNRKQKIKILHSTSGLASAELKGVQTVSNLVYWVKMAWTSSCKRILYREIF